MSLQARELFITELLNTVNEMVADIEEKEQTEPDLGIVREFVEQLREEIESLR